MANTQFDWLIILFVHEQNVNVVGETFEEFLKNFNQITNIKNKKVVVIFDEFKKNNMTEILFSKRVMVSDDESLIENSEIINDIDLTSKNSWKKILRNVIDEYVAKEILFMTYSHGNGFGINSESLKIKFTLDELKKYSITNDKILFKNDFRILKKGKKHPLASHHDKDDSNPSSTYQVYKYDSTYCKSLELLWISDLSDGLRMALKKSKKKINFFILLNCCMLTIDTCVFLRNNINNLIGFETLADSYGFDLVKLINDLDRPLEDKKRCENIIDNYRENVSKYDSELVKYTYMAALNLEVLSNPSLRILSDIFKRLSTKMQSVKIKLPVILEEQILPVPQSININKKFGTFKEVIDLYDLRYLLDLIEINLKDKIFTTLIRKWEISIAKLVVHQKNGEYIAEYDDIANKKIKPSGLSIFLPHDDLLIHKKAMCAINYNMAESYRGSLIEWDNFIKKIYSIKD